MSEYVYCWRVQYAYNRTDIQRENLVESLAGVNGAIEECPVWESIETPPPPSDFGPYTVILFRAATLHEALSQPAYDEEGHVTETWDRSQIVLKDVIRRTYEGQKPEKEAILRTPLDGDYFYRVHFWPLYLDSLLLRREDVRKYYLKNHIRQVFEADGLLFEDGTAIDTPPDIPSHQSNATPASASETPQPLAESKVKKPNTPLTVKKQVAKVADKTVCGRKTRNENKIALEWIAYWRSQGWNKKDIADTLSNAGGGDAVIGYLLAPEGEDLSEVDNNTARKRGRRARNLK